VQTTQSNAEATEAYEYALQRVGMDISSTPLWTDYISFINEYKPTAKLDEGQKINQLKSVYQRAIETPMHNLEAIWREYDAFENGMNKTLAKTTLTTYGPKYMHARSIYTERKRHYEGILRNMLARPPSASKDETQPSLWRGLIAYERGNPQRLEPTALKNRIAFTYNQALLCLWHYPEIWYEFAEEEIANGRPEESVKVYERSLEALPDCLVLYFTYANSLEQQKNIKAAKDVYERLIKKKSPGR